jgi:Bacterial Ig domain
VLPVEVGGFTGPCQDVRVVLGTPSQVEQPVTGGQGGAFLATVTVPKGTIPGTYGLELHATCRRVAVVGDKDVVEVVNQAPQPADDTATTAPGRAVDVPVGDNDVDPDGDDGYQMLVAPVSGAANGEVQAQPDGTIRYLPRAGFAGQDRFRYRSCDVVDPSGRLDCGTATVAVTVQAAGATATSQGGGGPGPATSGQVGGVTSIGPGPGTAAPPPTIVPGPVVAAADDRSERLVPLAVALATLLLAALAVAWRGERTRRQRAWTRQHVRGDPHPGPARTTVEVDARAVPAPPVRLQAHPDDGVQHLQEATP